MDGNKDDALKCLRIAKESIESGDKNRALKFLNKAQRLDPSIQIDDLLSKLDSSQPETKNSDEPINQNPSDSTGNGPRRRVSASGSSSSASYTEEQVTIVREVKRKKDYYEILGLEKSASVEDVKKAYKKLSLKVHPDKNKVPGAEEAFKKVSRAFQCLSNEESRKTYDLVGSDEPIQERRGGGNGMRGYNGFYDGDIDAEEIFRNFFFGGMHPAATANFSGFSFGPGVRVRTAGFDNRANGWRNLIQLLPVILIILLSFMPSQEPIYSLSKSYSYDYRFTTQKGVNFYVKSANFEQEYPPNTPQRVALEEKVESDYRTYLVHSCQNEWRQLHFGYRRETPSCDALRRFEEVAQ